MYRAFFILLHSSSFAIAILRVLMVQGAETVLENMYKTESLDQDCLECVTSY